jgi:hypothetical protein
VRTLEGGIPRELRAVLGSKPPSDQWRILTWSKTLKARVAACAAAFFGRAFRLRGVWFVAVAASIQRHEGNGAGDGVRLRERSKALEGKPHERIWSETRPASMGTVNAPRGSENL